MVFSLAYNNLVALPNNIWKLKKLRSFAVEGNSKLFEQDPQQGGGGGGGGQISPRAQQNAGLIPLEAMNGGTKQLLRYLKQMEKQKQLEKELEMERAARKRLNLLAGVNNNAGSSSNLHAAGTSARSGSKDQQDEGNVSTDHSPRLELPVIEEESGIPVHTYHIAYIILTIFLP